VIDHLVYAVPDLAPAVETLAGQLGIEQSPGGPHPGAGSRNYLLDLGGGSYLEIIGPDPEQPTPSGPRPFGIDDLQGPRLAGWAMKAPNIEELVARAKAAGYDPGPVVDMDRIRPDGVRLAWRLTRRIQAGEGGILPFLIDWGDTPHPATTSARGCTLVSFSGQHPEPARVLPVLQALGEDLPLAKADKISLRAVIDAPKGRVTLA